MNTNVSVYKLLMILSVMCLWGCTTDSSMDSSRTQQTDLRHKGGQLAISIAHTFSPTDLKQTDEELENETGKDTAGILNITVTAAKDIEALSLQLLSLQHMNITADEKTQQAWQSKAALTAGETRSWHIPISALDRSPESKEAPAVTLAFSGQQSGIFRIRSQRCYWGKETEKKSQGIPQKPAEPVTDTLPMSPASRR